MTFLIYSNGAHIATVHNTTRAYLAGLLPTAIIDVQSRVVYLEN